MAGMVAIVAAGAVDPLYALVRAGGSLKEAAEAALEYLDLAAIASAASRVETLQAENESLKRRLFRMGAEELDSEQPPWRVKTPHPP